MRGSILFISPKAPWGFIKPEWHTDGRPAVGLPDIFYHVNNFVSVNPRDIAPGVLVEYAEGRGNGKPCAVNIRIIPLNAPQAAPKGQPEIPYEPVLVAAPIVAPKQPRIAGQAKAILSTDDAPRPASAPASPGHAVTAAAALAEGDGQLKFGLTAPKTDAPQDGGTRE